MADYDSLILELYKKKIFKIGNFVLKSGDKSPFYIDLRLIPSYPSLFKSVIKIFEQLVFDLNYSPDGIAGLISGAIPYASGVCLNLNIPMLQIRKKSKSHGRKKLIEGRLDKNSKVVILDDLISTGSSKKDAIKILREEGYQVTDIIVLIDRRPTSKTENKILDTKVNSAITLSELLGSLKNRVDPDHEDFEKLLSAIETWN